MSKNIFIKLFISGVFIILLANSFLLPQSYASSISELFTSGKDFLDAGKSINKTINTEALENASDYIYNALFAIAVMVAIIVAMVLGIQFMVASAEEKAKVKEALMPFVVGCFVVFGSFTIWKVAVNIGNDAEDKILSQDEINKKDEEIFAEIEITVTDGLDQQEINALLEAIELYKDTKPTSYRDESNYQSYCYWLMTRGYYIYSDDWYNDKNSLNMFYQVYYKADGYFIHGFWSTEKNMLSKQQLENIIKILRTGKENFSELSYNSSQPVSIDGSFQTAEGVQNYLNTHSEAHTIEMIIKYIEKWMEDKGMN